MSALKFRKLTGLDAYEVRREDVCLGQVEQVDHIVTVRRQNSATLSKVKRWRFQMVGAMPSRLLYETRKRAAGGLAAFVDAHERARSRPAPEATARREWSTADAPEYLTPDEARKVGAL